jgi:7-keto-8-aminopelargonate synthetase-like enzyme
MENVYSMDDTVLPIRGMVDVMDDIRARLVVDEAHPAVIYGPDGGGGMMA